MTTQPGDRAQHGFTLIELVAVLVVLALIVALVGPRVGRRDDRAGLLAVAMQFAAYGRAVRTSAIRRGHDQVLIVDLGRRTVVADGLVPLRIPPAIDIQAETSAIEQTNTERATIRFYPNGSSSGGAIRFKSGQQGYEIRVNWFTGRVSVEATR